jgi:hypothetical protein
MSDAVKRWIGISVAVIAAVGLAASELVDREEEWNGAGSLDFEGAVTYETAGGRNEAELPDVSAGFDDATDVASRSVAAIDAPTPEVLPMSRLSVDRDGHFADTPAAVDVFDSYYRSYPTSSDEVVRGRIVLALLDALPPRAADEAISALDEWRAARH